MFPSAVPNTVPNKLKLGFLIALLTLPFASQVVLAGEEQRAPPEARTAGTLSDAVMRAMSSIQELLNPEDEADQDLPRAKEELDRLRERRWDRMNDFEKSTVLNFYTNYYLMVEDYPNALLTFEEILMIPELREDTRMRTLRSLGQLYMAEERWDDAIGAYQRWRELSPEEDTVVYRGLSYSYYQQEQYQEALPHWLDYMNLSLETGQELDRDDYQYLNGLYFNLEDYESALDLTRTMIMLFDNPTDWINFSSLYSELDDENRRVQSLNLAYLKGFLDDDTRYLNLGQSLAGLELPYTGAGIIQEGMDQGIVEEDEDNLSMVTQLRTVASDYEAALEPARRVAEMSDSGDGYDSLGYLHYMLFNYEEAAEAFQMAVDKGSLSDRPATLLFLARSLLELDDFEGALAAARQSADAGDESDREAATNYITFINNTRDVYNTLAERRENAIDYYQPYPSLID